MGRTRYCDGVKMIFAVAQYQEVISFRTILNFTSHSFAVRYLDLFQFSPPSPPNHTVFGLPPELLVRAAT